MGRRTLFKKRKNLNLMLSAEMVAQIDAELRKDEGETRTNFLRSAVRRELERRGTVMSPASAAMGRKRTRPKA